jgi:hypothetical protein
MYGAIIIQKGSRATSPSYHSQAGRTCTQLPLDTQAHHHQHRRHPTCRQRAAQPPPHRPHHPPQRTRPPTPTSPSTSTRAARRGCRIRKQGGNRRNQPDDDFPWAASPEGTSGHFKTGFALCHVPVNPCAAPGPVKTLPNAAARPGFESPLSTFLSLFLFGESQLSPLVS